LFLTKAFCPSPPITNTLSESRNVFEVWPSNSGILNEEHAVPIRRERAHYLLVTLPNKIPVNRRDADYVLAFQHVIHLTHKLRNFKMIGSRLFMVITTILIKADSRSYDAPPKEIGKCR
jgi:hypothetical protein